MMESRKMIINGREYKVTGPSYDEWSKLMRDTECDPTEDYYYINKGEAHEDAK